MNLKFHVGFSVYVYSNGNSYESSTVRPKKTILCRVHMQDYMRDEFELAVHVLPLKLSGLKFSGFQ